jgi:hypothetical protein
LLESVHVTHILSIKEKQASISKQRVHLETIIPYLGAGRLTFWLDLTVKFASAQRLPQTRTEQNSVTRCTRVST